MPCEDLYIRVKLLPPLQLLKKLTFYISFDCSLFTHVGIHISNFRLQTFGKKVIKKTILDTNFMLTLHKQIRFN